MFNAEPYIKNVKLERCFQCQKYAGHKTRYCRGQVRCDWCAIIGHTIESCPDCENPGKKACGLCGDKKGYCALNKHCLAHGRKEERARAAYKTRPIKFESSSLANNTHNEITLLSRSVLEEQDNEGFSIVGNKHRKNRPTLLSKADTTEIPSITSFLRMPEMQFRSLRNTASLVSNQDTLDISFNFSNKEILNNLA